MVFIPRVDQKARSKQGRNSQQTMQSLKNALASFKRNGQPWPKVGLDANGNIQIHDTTLAKHEQATGAATREPDRVTEQSPDDFADDGLNSLSLNKPKIRLESHLNHGRDRGRSILPRHIAEPTTHPYAQATAVLTSDSDDELPVIPKKHRQQFEIQDTAAVIDFLDSRLKKMQQLAVKKIAKAWIKGICPKKQANFPYQNKKRVKKVGLQPVVPEWWPDESVCRFIEPDHIMRQERVRLCIHLLRLRPSPEQLRAWNADKVDPHPTHVYQGWTAFLRELAGPGILDELPKEAKCKTGHREELMHQMYDIAQMEVDYLEGGIDGTDVYSYEEDEEEYSSPTLKRTYENPVDTSVERESSQSSVSRTRAKRARRASISEAATIVQQSHPAVGMMDQDAQSYPDEQAPNHAQYGANFFGFQRAADPSFEAGPANSFKMSEADNQPTQPSPLHDQHEAGPMKIESSTRGQAVSHCTQQQRQQPAFPHWNHHLHQQHWLKYESLPQQTQQEAPVEMHAARFRSYTTMKPRERQIQSAPPPYPNQQELIFPQYTTANMIQVQQVNQVPEPHFQPVPNIYSPPGTMAMQENKYAPHHPEQTLAQDQAYTTTMSPNQFLVPTLGDIGMIDFRQSIADSQQSQAYDNASQSSLHQQAYQVPHVHQQPTQQFHHRHEAQHSQQQQFLAEQQIDLMQCGGLPFTQPVEWSPNR